MPTPPGVIQPTTTQPATTPNCDLPVIDHSVIDHSKGDDTRGDGNLGWSGIDMLDPVQTCRLLDMTHAELLAVAKSGELATYDLGGHIRFRYRDAASLASRRAIAA